MGNYIASFATLNFSNSRKSFLNSCGKVIQNARVKVYEPSDLTPSFKKRFFHHLKEKKGFGLWCWKFFIVEDFLLKSNVGDVLFYSDIATRFVHDPFVKLEKYINGHDIMLFRSNGVERELTKIELFNRLMIDPNGIEGVSNQIYGGNFLIRNSVLAKEFFSRASEIFSDFDLARDPVGEELKAQVREFKFHRHDQSVISLLSKKYGIESFSDISQYGNLLAKTNLHQYGHLLYLEKSPHYLKDDVLLPQIIEHHRRRNDPPIIIFRTW